MERDRVIKGLECCAGQCNYHGCPYKDPCENANGVKQIMLDALALLKKQKEQKFFVDESGKITPLPVIVRCKDCCMGEPYPLEAGIIWCNRLFEPHKDDWYCADGKQKDGDGDAEN